MQQSELLKLGPYSTFRRLCTDVGTSYSLRCREATDKGLEALEEIRASFNPSDYRSSEHFALDYLVHSYISKLQVPDGAGDLEAECLTGFLETEKRNKEWNAKLKTTLPYGNAEALINSVRRKIRMVLGDPSQNLYRWAEHCDWGPGATYSLKSVESTRDKKINEKRLSITARAVPYFLAYVQTDYSWFASRTGIMPSGPTTWLPCHFNVVRGERFATAPKKWNKRRTISIQPTVNLFLQKGFGRFVRQRCKRWGIDLDDQSRNQRLASLCQMLGFATLDLKEASNSMLLEHIRLYFDEAWVNLMEDLRCPEIQLPDGTWHRLELHSAMGNGYTFEVESLLFWALAQSVADLSESPQRVSVYGDDIIVPQSVADETIKVLEANGFRINTEKSFTAGLFYESCGKHYFDTMDVTPVYEKTTGGELHNAIRSYNRLYRWCKRFGWEARFKRTLDFIECRAYQALLTENERRTRALRRLRRSSKRSSAKQPKMPYQALWMPGDGGLLTEDFSHLPYCDENGIWELTLLRAQPIQRKTDGWSMLSDTLRRAGLSSSDLTITTKRALLTASTGNETLASYGMVAPRDQTVWRFSKARFYNWSNLTE